MANGSDGGNASNGGVCSRIPAPNDEYVVADYPSGFIDGVWIQFDPQHTANQGNGARDQSAWHSSFAFRFFLIASIILIPNIIGNIVFAYFFMLFNFL